MTNIEEAVGCLLKSSLPNNFLYTHQQQLLCRVSRVLEWCKGMHFNLKYRLLGIKTVKIMFCIKYTIKGYDSY